MTTKAKKSVKKAFDFMTIKTFEDACKKVNHDPKNLPDISMIPARLRKFVLAAFKLAIIAEAINDGWKPDWTTYKMYKWFPWFNLSSGCVFSNSDYNFSSAYAGAGSRLCFETEAKSDYCGKHFIKLYVDLMVIKK